jgi:mRNA interferase RelE/StbE
MVNYSKNSKKFLTKNKKEGILFFKAFQEIANNKDQMKFYDIKYLTSSNGKYRLRIGKYRAIFKVEDEKLIIIVIIIDSRGQIYKKIT